MSDRLRLAVENGHVVLPEGNLLVLEPREDSDLSVFSRGETAFYVRRASIESVLRRSGWLDEDIIGEWAAAVVFLPREKAAQRATIRFAHEVVAKAPIIIDGGKSDGVEAMYRALKNRADVSEPWSKSHGKIFTFEGGSFDDWPELGATEAEDGWWRAPGVFSADGIDPASQFLADSLPPEMTGYVVDLGAGWGFLSREIVTRDSVKHLDLVEDDVLALSAAAHNVKDMRVSLHHADALTWRPDALVDHVVTNPPFHVGRAADPSLGQAFIRAAAAMLKPKGQLWLVANRHLPYEGTLKDAFRTVELHAETPSFRIFHATSPTRRKG